MDSVSEGEGQAKMIKKILLLLILMSGVVLGLGIGPVKTNLIYVPDGSETVELKIINNEHRNMKLAVYAKGELEKSISFSQQIITVTEDQEYIPLSYTIRYPDGLKPGKRTASIYVLELPDEFSNVDQTMISATTGVVSQLEVQVPYPGKYAEARLLVEATDKDIIFKIPVYNFGQEDILNASATIGIYGPTYELIAEIKTNSLSIASESEGRLLAVWEPDVNPGAYFAIATVDYDGRKIRLEETFSVSNLMLSIKEINIREFNIGEIAVLDITVSSAWGSQIKDVFGNIEISRKGAHVASIKTPSVDVPGMGSALRSAATGTLQGSRRAAMKLQ
jgi:hypothetical protein